MSAACCAPAPIASRLNCDLAIIDKRRERAGVSEVMNVIGDVQDRDCILIDDIVDSGGTLCNAAAAPGCQRCEKRQRLHHAWRAFRAARSRASPRVRSP